MLRQGSRQHSDVLCCQKSRMYESLDQAGERFEGGYTPGRGIAPRSGLVPGKQGWSLDEEGLGRI